MVNRISPTISLTDFSLVVYRSTMDFCILLLHPAILLYSLVSSSNFLVAFLGFSMYSIMSSADSFTTFFPIWFPFISFSSLIVVAKTAKTMLNNSGESGHHCLVPDLRGRGDILALFLVLVFSF